MAEINWRGIDLNLLLTFDALIRFQSVSAASRHLHLGQPATSYNLKRLRELLADPLFERQGNRMEPTRRALEIAPKVSAILTIFRDDILPTHDFTPSQFEGVFKIGLSDYAEQIFGPDIFDALQRLAPKAKILFKPADSDSSTQLLESHDVDVCIGVFNTVPDTLSSTFLYRERHLCIFDNNEINTILPISLATYLSTPQLIITANQLLSSQVDQRLASMGAQRHVALGSTRFLTIRRMLSGRKLLAVMAEMVGRSELIDDQLTLCEPPIDIPNFDVDMVTLKRDEHHLRLQWLTDLIRDVVQQKVTQLRQAELHTTKKTDT
jgi:DNA-binding transcriptional LysR family regulator